MKASAQRIVFQTSHEDKERNEKVDAPAKEKGISTHSVVVAIFDELSGSHYLPAYGKPTKTNVNQLWPGS